MAKHTSTDLQQLNVTFTGQPLVTTADILKKPIYNFLEVFLDITIASIRILLNAVELFILHKNRKNRTYNEILLINLSIADLLFSVSEIILTVLHSIVLTECGIWYNISNAFLFASILHLMFMTIE